jgi:hypothetical protein
VPPGPDDDLTRAMIARAGDLVHYMHQNGRSIAVGSGVSPSGIPCTVIYAVGDYAESLRDVAQKVVEWVAKTKAETAAAAKNN